MKSRRFKLTLSATAALCIHSVGYADNEVEYLFFVSIDDLERSSLSEPALPASDLTPTVDFLLSYEKGKWRAVGEYLLTDDEAELERMQVGYNYSDDNTIWFGRFHQPLSAWKHRYHHGAYLQPSISRPSIENWEDESGVIPSHVTGVLVEHWQTLSQNSGVRYSAAIGIAPTMDHDELFPFDIFDPDDSSGRIAGSFNVAFYPDYVGSNSFGLLGGYADIKGTPNPEAGVFGNYEVRQTVLGAQANWEFGDVQLLSVAYYVDNDGKNIDDLVGGWFLAGYAQALVPIGNRVDGYLRFEHTRNARHTAYLNLFPYYIFRRELIGMRWDFTDRQALGVEISNNKVVSDTFSEVRVQWSAVFP